MDSLLGSIVTLYAIDNDLIPERLQIVLAEPTARALALRGEINELVRSAVANVAGEMAALRLQALMGSQPITPPGQETLPLAGHLAKIIGD